MRCAGWLVVIVAGFEAVPACPDAGCCAEFCDTSDPQASAGCDATLPGTECVSWYERGQAPPGYENVGVCVAPLP